MKKIMLFFCIAFLAINTFCQSSLLEQKNVIETYLKKGIVSTNQTKEFSNKKSALNIESTFGNASITESGYNFDWMIFPEWYYKSDESYTDFTTIDQKYKDIKTFTATLTLYIHKTGTVDENASTGIDVANAFEATILKNMESTTFNNISCKYNSYTFLYSGVTFSIDEWYFEQGGTVYEYKIFTTVDDWNTNKSLYILMKQGLFFQAKTTTKTLPISNVKVYPNPAVNNVSFSAQKEVKYISVINIEGVEVKTINVNSSTGSFPVNELKPGYYFVNFNLLDGTSVKKLQLIN